MIIITAADRRYFSALINLVGSIHVWASEIQVIVYDLGLGVELIKEVEKWKNVTMVRQFLDRAIPDHCRELNKYAWKPLVIWDAMQSHDNVLWIDAGSDIRAPMGEIASLLDRDGHFFVQGQDLDMTRQSHEKTYEMIGADKQHYVGKEHFAGNLQGYVHGSEAYTKILLPLKRFAEIEQCISPQGSNLQNHRYDQTILSILLYHNGIDVEPHTRILAYKRSQLSQDPMQKSDKVVYTARGSSKEYSFSVLDRNDNRLYKLQ